MGRLVKQRKYSMIYDISVYDNLNILNNIVKANKQYRIREGSKNTIGKIPLVEKISQHLRCK